MLFVQVTSLVAYLRLSGHPLLPPPPISQFDVFIPVHLAEDGEAEPMHLDIRSKFVDLVMHGNLVEVEEMLRASGAGASAELIEGTGYAIPTLVLAALASPAEMVRLLIDHGAEVDLKTNLHDPRREIPLGSSALHCAASQGRLEVVLVLLEAGASPNIRDGKEATPLWYVTRFHDPENHVAITRALLEAGADPLLTDWREATPFHVAAGRGNIEVVDILLEKAPQTLNQTTVIGATALYLAATEPGLDDMVSHLLSRGATNEAVLGTEWCPLTGAVHYALESMVRVLLKEGWKAIGGPVALPRAIHLAATKDLPRTLQMLLDAEGSERRQSWSRCLCSDPFVSPLHRAIASDSVGAVSVLLQAGANEGVMVNRIFNKYNHEKRMIFASRTPKRDQVRKAAVRRTVARVAAFRARSWALPVVGGDAGAGAAAVSPAAPPAEKTSETGGRRPFFVFGASRPPRPTAPLGVRIYRPRRKMWLVGLVGR